MLSYITPVLDKIFLPLVTDQQKKISFFNYLLTNIVPRLLTPLIYGVRDKHFSNHMKRFYLCKLPIVKVESSKKWAYKKYLQNVLFFIFLLINQK